MTYSIQTLLGVAFIAISLGMILGFVLFAVLASDHTVRLDEVHYVAGEPHQYVLVPVEHDAEDSQS